MMNISRINNLITHKKRNQEIKNFLEHNSLNDFKLIMNMNEYYLYRKSNFVFSLFNCDNIIKEIMSSFHHVDEFQQLNIDYHRMLLYYNYLQYNNDDFLLLLKKYKFYQHFVFGNLFKLLIMLSTQASFAHIYGFFKK